MNRCNYVFPNQTQNHNKDDICNCVIRKKNQYKCWKHQDKKQPLVKNECDEDECHTEDNNKDTNDKLYDFKSDFIQLVNSK